MHSPTCDKESELIRLEAGVSRRGLRTGVSGQISDEALPPGWMPANCPLKQAPLLVPALV